MMTEPQAKREAAELLKDVANDLARFLDRENAQPGAPGLPRLVVQAIRLRIDHVREIESALRGDQ